MLPPGHAYALVVRAPFVLADAAVAALLVRLIRAGRGGRTAGFVYSLSPVAAAVPSQHGQFEPFVILPLVTAVSIANRRPWAAGLLMGVGIAIKPWPVFFLPVLLAALPVRLWPRLLIGAAATPAVAFGIYAVVHPAHIADGMNRVITCRAHRQGFGISPLLPDDAPGEFVNKLNLFAGMISVALGVLSVRRGRPVAEAVALAVLTPSSCRRPFRIST